MNKNLRDKGFTLLELMLAVVIFGFLMMAITSFLSSEIHSFNNAVAQDEVDEKARTSMMQILDVIQLKRSTFCQDMGVNVNNNIHYFGVYYNTDPDNPVNSVSLINPDPDSQDHAATIYYVSDYNQTHEGALFYRDNSPYSPYLISDDIDKFSIIPPDPQDNHLIQIDLIVKDPRTNQKCELLTYKRLH